MRKSTGLRTHRVFGAIGLFLAVIVATSVSAKDYKQCVILDIQKPSNKVVYSEDNATDTVVLDSKMLFFTTGDNFNVVVSNKCKEQGELYVTVEVPGQQAGSVSKYYHYLDSTAGGLPAMALQTDKKAFAEDFPKGASTTLWSFVVPESLSFAGPVVFQAHLVYPDTGKTIAFDAKTVYINFGIDP